MDVLRRLRLRCCCCRAFSRLISILIQRKKREGDVNAIERKKTRFEKFFVNLIIWHQVLSWWWQLFVCLFFSIDFGWEEKMVIFLFFSKLIFVISGFTVMTTTKKSLHTCSVWSINFLLFHYQTK